MVEKPEGNANKDFTDTVVRLSSPDPIGDDNTGAPQSAAGDSTPKVITQTIVRDRQKMWQKVAGSILSADNATIIGIAPIGLIGALGRSMLKDPSSIQLDSLNLNYITPLPEIIPKLGLTTSELEYEQRRWLAGYQGMDSITSYIGKSSGVLGYGAWLQDCIVRVQSGGSTTYWQIHYLPVNKNDLPEETCFAVHRCDDLDDLEQYFAVIENDQKPFLYLQAICPKSEVVDEMQVSIPTLKVEGFKEFGADSDDDNLLWPVVAVMARHRTTRETELLLRKRDKLNDRDSDGKLSLLSSRLTVDDFVARRGLPNSIRGLEPNDIMFKLSHPEGDILLNEETFSIQLSWIKGKTVSVPLDEETFRIAAQRLVLREFGLSVDAKRLKFVRFVVRKREEIRGQLGFAIFLLDLQVGSGDKNEVKAAERQTSGSLQHVTVGQLKAKEDDLNDLLKAHLSEFVSIAKNE